MQYHVLLPVQMQNIIAHELAFLNVISFLIFVGLQLSNMLPQTPY